MKNLILGLLILANLCQSVRADLVPDVTKYKAASAVFYGKNTSRLNRIVDSYAIAIHYHHKIEGGLQGEELRNKILKDTTHFRSVVQDNWSCLQNQSCNSSGAGAIKQAGKLISQAGSKYGLPAVYELGMAMGGDRIVNGWAQQRSRQFLNDADSMAAGEIHGKLIELSGDKYFTSAYNTVRSESSTGANYRLGLEYNAIKDKLTDREADQLNYIVNLMEGNEDLAHLIKEDLGKLTKIITDTAADNTIGQDQLKKIILDKLSEIKNEAAREHLKTRASLGELQGMAQVLLNGQYNEAKLIEKYGKEAVESLKAIKLQMDEEKELRAAQALAYKNYQKKMARIQEIEIGVTIVTNILSYKKPELAAKINGVMQIAFRLSRLHVEKSGGQTLVTPGILTGNYILAAMELYSMFNQQDPGPTPEEIILEALQQISEQLVEISKQMNTRFDLVDRKLNLILFTLKDELEHVHRGVDHVYQQSRAISRRLEALNSQLVGSEERVLNALRDILDQGTMECHTSYILLNRTPNDQSFVECETKFLNWALFVSGNNISNQSFSSDLGTKEIVKKLEVKESEIGVDAEVANAFTNLRVIDQLTGDFSGVEFFNSIEWLRGTQWLQTFWMRHSKQMDPTVAGIAKERLLGMISDMRKGLGNMHDNFEALFYGQVKSYEDSANSLKRQLRNVFGLKRGVSFMREAKPVFWGRDVEISLPQEVTPVNHCLKHDVVITNEKGEDKYFNEDLKDVTFNVPNLRPTLWKTSLRGHSTVKILFAKGLLDHKVCFQIVGHHGTNAEILKSKFRNGGTYPREKFAYIYDGGFYVRFNSVFYPNMNFIKEVRNLISDRENHSSLRKLVLSRYEEERQKDSGLKLKDFLMRPIFKMSNEQIATEMISGIYEPNIEGFAFFGHRNTWWASMQPEKLSEKSFVLKRAGLKEKIERGFENIKGRVSDYLVEMTAQGHGTMTPNFHENHGYHFEKLATHKKEGLSEEKVFSELSRKEYSQLNRDLAAIANGTYKEESNPSNAYKDYFQLLTQVKKQLFELELRRVVLKNLVYVLFPNDVLEDDLLKYHLMGAEAIVGRHEFAQKLGERGFYNYQLKFLVDSRVRTEEESRDWIDIKIFNLKSEVKRVRENKLKNKSDHLPAPISEMENKLKERNGEYQ